MKSLTFITVFLIPTLFFFSNLAFSQTKITGKWEGSFMGDFKTIIELQIDDESRYTGTIQMFNGEIKIQDDELSNIILEKEKLTFLIKAKETTFKGTFFDDFSGLKGSFIFPDNSEHPIELKKGENITESKGNYEAIINKKYKAEELLSDLDFLVSNLNKYHPALYAYTSKETFYEKVESIKNQINSEKNVAAFFKIIAPLVESIKCSHTGIRLSPNVQNLIQNYGNYFPLKLAFINDKAYCINSITQKSAINPGTEIVSINGKTIQDIKTEIQGIIPSEGNNTSTKDYILNKEFNSLYYFNDNSETFDIQYKSSNSIIEETIDACKFSALHNSEKVIPDYPVIFEMDEENSTGYLNLISFQIPEINEYIQRMDEIFSGIQEKQIANLILDLRGNPGGHPIFAAQLFSYLTNKEFTWFIRNNDVPDFEPLYNKMNPSGYNFTGKLFVLTDGGCLSTTGHLISHLQTLTDAVFIGEEPGSTYLCSDFSVNLKLPNTGIEVNIPRTQFITAVENPEILVPFPMDYKVQWSVNNLLSNTDPVFNFTKKLIK